MVEPRKRGNRCAEQIERRMEVESVVSQDGIRWKPAGD
jgi:hypothetical protein